MRASNASEMWAQGVPEISDDPSALFDPSVSLNDESQEFQSRKQTGPEAAFLNDEMFLSRRDTLDNGFEAKDGLRSSSQKLSTVSCFGFTFRQQTRVAIKGRKFQGRGDRGFPTKLCNFAIITMDL